MDDFYLENKESADWRCLVRGFGQWRSTQYEVGEVKEMVGKVCWLLT